MKFSLVCISNLFSETINRQKMISFHERISIDQNNWTNDDFNCLNGTIKREHIVEGLMKYAMMREIGRKHELARFDENRILKNFFKNWAWFNSERRNRRAATAVIDEFICSWTGRYD